jgi:hypothetical protein
VSQEFCIPLIIGWCIQMNHVPQPPKINYLTDISKTYSINHRNNEIIQDWYKRRQTRESMRQFTG